MPLLRLWVPMAPHTLPSSTASGICIQVWLLMGPK